MKAFKLKEDYGNIHKGRIYFPVYCCFAATPTEPTVYGIGINPSGDIFEPIEVENEKWVHPHLITKIKSLVVSK